MTLLQDARRAVEQLDAVAREGVPFGETTWAACEAPLRAAVAVLADVPLLCERARAGLSGGAEYDDDIVGDLDAMTDRIVGEWPREARS